MPAPQGGECREHAHATRPGTSDVHASRKRSSRPAASQGAKLGVQDIAQGVAEQVDRDWNLPAPPFADVATEAGERREDARTFIIALVAALVGGLSDAIEQNNDAIAGALVRREPRRRRHR